MISPGELRQKLINPRVPDSELRDLVLLDEESRDNFEPLFRANPDTVDIRSMVLDGLLAGVNRVARERRQLQYKLRVNNPFFRGQKIVSEGDSWFQFPLILQDVIDQLFRFNPLDPLDGLDGYAVFSLGAAGDLLRDIVNEDEITQAIEAEKPEVFLISGGGNDLVADGNLANFLNQFDSEKERTPEDYIIEEFDVFLREIIQLYRDIFIRLLSRFPNLKIIFHGYDYAIPNNGNSLGKPMETRDITDPDLQKDIIRVIIDRLNEAQISLIEDVQFAGLVHHVDYRGVVGDNNWFDELHPNDKGFKAVGNIFDKKIKDITRR